MYKLIILAIIGCTLGVILRYNFKELYVPFQVGFAIIILLYILSNISDSIRSFIYVIESIGTGYSVIKIMLKAALISIGARLGSDICKESGNYLLADIIEIGGKLVMFILAAPYILDVIKISVAFL